MEDRKIEIYPSSILLVRARSMRRPDAKLADILRNSLPHYAVGLAAPQIGISRRAIVWRQEEETEVIWNPTYKASGEAELGLESCLSLPGETFIVPRWKEITLSGKSENWQPLTVILEGWPARIIQHEVDHLDGILINQRGQPYQENDQVRVKAE